MSDKLFKKIEAILKGKMIKEDDYVDTSSVEGEEDIDTSADTSVDDAGVEGIEGEEEVETLASYVGSLEDRLTDEDKENVKMYIQSIIDAAEAGEEGSEGIEGGDEYGADSLSDVGGEEVSKPTLEAKFAKLNKKC